MNKKETKLARDEIYVALTEYLDTVSDEELEDILRGNHKPNLKLCDDLCICGSTENVPCQWLNKGDTCAGNHCPHMVRRDLLVTP